MTQIDLPYIGFTISWSFHDRTDKRYQNYKPDQQPSENVFSDLEIILRICQKFELLFPTYYRDNQGNDIHFETDDITQVIKILKEHTAQQRIQFEIIRLGGYGYLYLDETEKVMQRDLITVDDIRFFERSILVCTQKGPWIPISIDETYQFNWQVNLAKVNSIRLENCLQGIRECLNINVYPSESDIERENPIWQKGFKLYASPSVLEREFLLNPPGTGFDIGDYLI